MIAADAVGGAQQGIHVGHGRGADRNGQELRVGEMTRRAADHVAGLVVLHQPFGLGRDRASHAARHHVHGDLPRSDDAEEVEKLIHRLFRRAGLWINNEFCGDEWFMTTPEQVAACYSGIENVVNEFSAPVSRWALKAPVIANALAPAPAPQSSQVI